MALREKDSEVPEVLVARETIVINVGGPPPDWARITVKDRRTGQMVEIDDTDHPPIVEEDPGIPYLFKAGQRVLSDHPAVTACPGAFRPPDATDVIIYPNEGTGIRASR